MSWESMVRDALQDWNPTTGVVQDTTAGAAGACVGTSDTGAAGAVRILRP